MTRPAPDDRSQATRSRRALTALALSLLATCASCAPRANDRIAASTTAAPSTARSRTTPPPVAATSAFAFAGPAVSASADAHAGVAARSAAPAASPLPTGPAILSVKTSAAVLHAGDTVVWTVRTTPEIVTVTASTSLIKLDLPRRAPGLFALPFTIPAAAPSFFHGNYLLSIVATDQAGRTATSSIALDFE